MANNTFPNTKKLSEGETKSLSDLKNETDVYVPAFKTGEANYKVPVSDFGRASSGGGSKVIITDYSLNDVYIVNSPDYYEGIPSLYNPGTGLFSDYIKSMVIQNTYGEHIGEFTKNCARVTVNRGDGFMTPTEDCDGFQTKFWQNYPPGLFKFKGATELEIYRWHAIFAAKTGWPERLTEENIAWFFHNDTLYIDMNDLDEGIIYTIKVHTMILPFKEETGHTYQGTNMFKQATNDSLYRFRVIFSIPTSSTGTTLHYPSYWGDECDQYAATGPNVAICQHELTTPNKPYPGSVEFCKYQEAANGELVFVKLDDKIYIMSY